MNFLNGMYTQTDFDNLTKNDIRHIKDALEMTDTADDEIIDYLYNNMDLVENNNDVKQMLSSKMLAGQLSVKWMRFFYAGEFTEENLQKRLESKNNGYNVGISERINEDTEEGIACIWKNDSFYTIRVLISEGKTKLRQDGISYKYIPTKKTIIVNIDINNRWIEYRCESKILKKIRNIVEKELAIENVTDIALTNKYKDIEEFKNDLCNGFRTNIIAKPQQDFQLEKEDKREFAEMFSLIDQYITDRDGNKLVDGLSKLSLNFEGIPTIMILLTNIATFKFDIPDEATEDYDESLIHMLTKNFTTESSSFIEFSLHEGGQKYTLRLSLNNSSVRFVSSVTEDVISYIRNKVV